jgi:hypothetical protein
VSLQENIFNFSQDINQNKGLKTISKTTNIIAKKAGIPSQNHSRA